MMNLEERFKRVIEDGIVEPKHIPLTMAALGHKSCRVTESEISDAWRDRDTGAEGYNEESDCPFCEETAQLGDDFRTCNHYVTDHKGFVLWSEEEDNEDIRKA